MEDNILIPFIKPVEAEMIKASTVVKQIKNRTKFVLGIANKSFNPPERVRIPAPSDAAIPATRAKRHIASTRLDKLREG